MKLWERKGEIFLKDGGRKRRRRRRREEEEKKKRGGGGKDEITNKLRWWREPDSVSGVIDLIMLVF